MENVELKGGYISFSRPGTYAYEDTVSKSNIGAQSPLPSVLFSVTITLRGKGGEAGLPYTFTFVQCRPGPPDRLVLKEPLNKRKCKEKTATKL